MSHFADVAKSRGASSRFYFQKDIRTSRRCTQRAVCGVFYVFCASVSNNEAYVYKEAYLKSQLRRTTFPHNGSGHGIPFTTNP